MLKRPAVYSMVPRISLANITQMKNLRYLHEIERIKYRMANVRNPFARFYSAWNDKFRVGWRHKEYHENMAQISKLLRNFENCIIIYYYYVFICGHGKTVYNNHWPQQVADSNSTYIGVQWFSLSQESWKLRQNPVTVTVFAQEIKFYIGK